MRNHTPYPPHVPLSKRSQAGISLIEVQIALVTIAIGAISTVASMLTAERLDSELRERTIALHAAHNVMEEILNQRDDIPLMLQNYGVPVPPGNGSTAENTGSQEGSQGGLPLPYPSGGEGSGEPYGSAGGGSAGVHSVTIPELDVGGRGPGVCLVAFTPLSGKQVFIEVTVTWTNALGQRSLTIPMYIAETIQ